MSELCSSDIRDLLQLSSDDDDFDSDISLPEELPDNFILESDLNESESELDVLEDEVSRRPSPVDVEGEESSCSDSSLPLIYRISKPKWIRVLPPEPALDIADKFTVRHAGIRDCPPKNSSPMKYFYLFFTNYLWNLLVKETNNYAQNKLLEMTDSGTLKKFSRMNKWVDLSVQDMKSFIALVINMGIDKRNNIVDYWKTRKSLYLPFFSNTMSLKKFQLINSVFRICSTPGPVRGQPGYDPWHKIRPLLDHVNNTVKRHFIPHQNISIDESLIGMKNRCIFIQYMPKKKHCRFGIKKFVL